VLLTGDLAWGATAFDYDNDGDPDLFITDGGNEGIGFAHLFRNLWVESGGTQLLFKDVTKKAGVLGPTPPGEDSPIPVSGAGAVAADYDRDGWTDVFENVNITPQSLHELRGRNILWHNNGDGTFTDVTDRIGLGKTREQTRHSTWIDYDNDGDPDLYENDFEGFNHLWQNRLVEDGRAHFVDVTKQLSPPGDNLACPWQSFGSTTADFNNDGWQDLIVFMRWSDGEPPQCPYGPGHVIFMNEAGTGFVNIGQQARVNQPFIFDKGVMGCQVGDVNGDGAPDVYIGNGAPMDSNDPLGGQYDQLVISSQPHGGLPLFVDGTKLIDFPAPQDPGIGEYPPYPYRTHGTAIVDVDGDGTQEIAVSEGGPARSGDYVREPDRLFKLTFDPNPSWVILHAVGDGMHVSADAIGTRFALTVRNDSGKIWTIHQTLTGGSCFSASNGPDVYFGLSNATSVVSLQIQWPDGTIDNRAGEIPIDQRTSLAYPKGGRGDLAPPGTAPLSVDTTAQIQALLAAHPRTPKSAYRNPPPGFVGFDCDWVQ
jgi:hypothetical protein